MKRSYTIVLPLRNGGDYLKECVASILAQSYPDFEIAVLENNSTDGSLEWLQGQHDKRIKIYAAPSDLTIEQNWARARTVPRREWMTFIGHDDRLLPNFLQIIDDLIEAYPDASLYQTHFHFIDETGARLRACAPFPPRETATELLQGFLTHQRESYSGFVMRTADYDAFGGIPPYTKLLWADHALWVGLTRKTWKCAAPDEGFSLRVHHQSAAAAADWEAYTDAMRAYIAFLQDLSEDAAFDAIVKQYAPAFFLDFCRNKLYENLVHATKKNRVLEPRALRELTEVLSLIAPDLAPQLPHTNRLRRRTLINRTPLLRWTYRTYIRARYGSEAL